MFDPRMYRGAKIKQIAVVNCLTAGKGTQEGGERVSGLAHLAQARQKGLNTSQKCLMEPRLPVYNNKKME